MWLQTQAGLWRQCSTRNPESLVILAHSEYQEVCVRLGGRNSFRMPRLRLVWAPSCFTFAGGFEVHFWDDHGNQKGARLETVFVPKYHMPEGMEDCFVLEEWRPPEFYRSRAAHEVIYSEAGQPVRQLEPLTSRGGYEAVEMEMAFPVPFFNRYTKLKRRTDGSEFSAAPMTISMVEHIIRRYFQVCAMRRAVKAAKEQEHRKREEKLKREQLSESIRESFGPFAHGLIPFAGYGQKMPEFQAGKLN